MPHGPSGAHDIVAKIVDKTVGMRAAKGLGVSASSDPSPYAHPVRGRTPGWGPRLLGVVMLFAVCTRSMLRGEKLGGGGLCEDLKGSGWSLNRGRKLYPLAPSFEEVRLENDLNLSLYTMTTPETPLILIANIIDNLVIPEPLRFEFFMVCSSFTMSQGSRRESWPVDGSDDTRAPCRAYQNRNNCPYTPRTCRYSHAAARI